MSIKDVILQGFTQVTHLDGVRWVLGCPQLVRALFSLAFVKKSGADLLASELKQVGDRVTVFAGIRNGITSRQGLETLLDFGVTTYVVDTGSRAILFHPKVFFAQGETEARLLIGSANLTAGGLNNNFEAGVRIHLEMSDTADRALVRSIARELDAMPSKHPENVFRMHGNADLAYLEKTGRLLDESLVVAPHPATTAATPSEDNVQKIVLANPPVYPRIRKATVVPAIPVPVVTGVAVSVSVVWERVWVSKPLTERDLTIPASRKTHPTGSMNLDKGMLPADVDHRHYFRDEVFNHLTWSPESRTVAAAEADFQLVIKGISYGQSRLRVAHTTSTTSTAYRQRNAMTRLRWGQLRPFIAQRNLLDRTLTLYRDNQNPATFMIEID